MNQLKLLNKLSKTLTLLVNKNDIVVKCYSKYLNNSYLEDKELGAIFTIKVFNKLKQLDYCDNIVIKYIDKEFEVQKIKLSKNEIAYFFYDVTQYSDVKLQLKNSLDSLRSKKEELQAVFDLAANGISILDTKGMFLYANKFFQEMMEYSMEELYTESCISLSSKEYAKSSQNAVQQAIKNGSIQNFRKVCITKSGIHINASMSLSYLNNRDEILMITSDITQDIKYQNELKKQVEIEVKKRTEQYEVMCHQSRLAAMGEMIDSIAHQWRQPLNGLGIIVQGLMHLSRQKDFNLSLLKEIEMEIMEKITYMSQTIDDFSKFFRITKAKEYFDILKSIHDAIRLIDVQLKIHSINIEVKVLKGVDVFVMGFANEFRQVILNMIHNAMVAIVSTKQKNGKVDIFIKSSKNNIDIIITDNGGGIQEKDLPKIFDPYFTTKNKGSGIGLYMSKVIIEHHMGGHLEVKNKKNGVSFTIMLKKG